MAVCVMLMLSLRPTSLTRGGVGGGPAANLRSGSVDDTDAMVLGITDKNRAIIRHKNPVRSRKLAFERIAFRIISTLARAGNQLNRSFFDVNHPDGVILRVRDIDISVRTNRDALRPVHRRIRRWSAFTGKSFLSRSRHVMNHARYLSQLQHCIAFS